MNASSLRVIGVLVGDIDHASGPRTKYAPLFESLGRRFELVGVCDATLRGLPRWINALQVAHPNRRVWRERFYKNVPAFRERSRRAAALLRRMMERVDVVLQVGVLFDSQWDDLQLPSVIYTDYTACLSAQRPAAGRSPFITQEREQWIDLERNAFVKATHICARSQLVRESILTDYCVAPERVTVVGGGVNFLPLPDPTRRAASEPPTALFIGKELHRKGGDLLLKAFALTRSQIPDARLLLLTGDSIPAGLPLAGVEVVVPTWDRERIAALYRRADLFVLPSRLETWGDVLLEAMAFGLPCIGVAGQAMEEIIEHEHTGLIVPPEEVSALAVALIRVLSDPALRHRWGDAGRRRVEAEFTWDRVATRMAPILQRASQPQHA